MWIEKEIIGLKKEVDIINENIENIEKKLKSNDISGMIKRISEINSRLTEIEKNLNHKNVGFLTKIWRKIW